MPEYSHEQNLRLAQKMLEQQGQITDLTKERDGAYRERAHLLALLAALHPSVIAPAPDVDEDGCQILYLRIDGKQASWHIHPDDTHLFIRVEQVAADDRRAQWDGHTTEQKYTHIGQHTARLYAEARGRAETPAHEQYRFATTWSEYHAGRRAALDELKVDESGPVAAEVVHPEENPQGSAPDGVDDEDDHQGQVVPATLTDAIRQDEADVQRVIDLYERWVKSGAPPVGTSISRWWDTRLAELHTAIRPPKEQP